MINKLNIQPYKGTRDFYPEDMIVRNYIFDIWRKVCKSYGYEEYDGPFLESFEIYAAKSGEELVNEQLYSFEDRGGRKIAIRPEMTPTLARMVSQRFNELIQPVKWFSISNFWRYEKPQKGRGREFFQLNIDIFGVEGIEADFEMIQTMMEIMKRFGAKENMFEIRFNNRRLADDVYKSLDLKPLQIKIVNKALDKKSKITEKEFNDWLKEEAKLIDTQIFKLNEYLLNPYPTIIELSNKGSEGAKEITKLIDFIETKNLGNFVKFKPTIIRGLDYYTGNVFEIFDINPKNTRSIAGGGRYDDLITIFKGEKLTGIGYAMGDITLKDFLEGWNLIPNFVNECEYLVTTWPSKDNKFSDKSMEISNILRTKGLNVSMWLDKDTKIDKQLKYADKRGFKYAVIIGDNEIEKDTVTLKNLLDKTQKEIKISNL